MNNDGLLRVFIWLVFPSISICVWMPLPDKMKLDKLLSNGGFSQRKSLRHDDANRRRYHAFFSGTKALENTFPTRYRKQSEYVEHFNPLNTTDGNFLDGKIKNDFGSTSLRRNQQANFNIDYSKICGTHGCKGLTSMDRNVSDALPIDIQHLQYTGGKIYPLMKKSQWISWNNELNQNEAMYVPDKMNVFDEMNRLDNRHSMFHAGSESNKSKKKNAFNNSSYMVVAQSDSFVNPTRYRDDFGTLQGILPLLKTTANIAFSKYSNLPLMGLDEEVAVSARTRAADLMICTDRNVEIESNIKSGNMMSSSDDNIRKIVVVYHTTRKEGSPTEDFVHFTSVTKNPINKKVKKSVDNLNISLSGETSHNSSASPPVDQPSKRILTTVSPLTGVDSSKPDKQPSLSDKDKTHLLKFLSNFQNEGNGLLNPNLPNTNVLNDLSSDVVASTRIGENVSDNPTEAIIQINATLPSAKPTVPTTSYDEYLNIMKIPEIIEKLCDKLEQKLNNSDPFKMHHMRSNASATKINLKHLMESV